MSVNVELLESTMTKIMDDPKSWRQAAWMCGTTACFAGHVAQQQGYVAMLYTDIEDRGQTMTLRPRYQVGENIGYDQRCLNSQNDRSTVREVARDALGLDDEQSLLLFAGDNTIDKLQLIVKGLANGETVEEIKAALCEEMDVD